MAVGHCINHLPKWRVIVHFKQMFGYFQSPPPYTILCDRMNGDVYSLISISISGTSMYYYALTKSADRYLQFVYESVHSKNGRHTSVTGLTEYMRKHGYDIDDLRITELERGPYSDIIYARKKAIKGAWLKHDFSCLNIKHMNYRQLDVYGDDAYETDE